jgi:hypothetical protein
MADDFMAESFWNEQAGWHLRSVSLRDAWEGAVARTAEHFVERDLRPAPEAAQVARDWLENVVDFMQKFNPGISKKECVENVAHSYELSQDIEWTMAADSLLGISVKRGETNSHYKP